MAVEFRCPCGRALVADEAHRGLEVRCVACGRALRVPQAPGAVAEETKPVCGHCGAPLPGPVSTCPKCGAFLDPRGPSALGPPPVQPQAPPAPSRPGLPWERRSEIGTMKAGFQTLQMVLLHPSAAFEAMGLEAPAGDAFLFFAIVGCGGAVIGAVWNAVFQSAVSSFIDGLARSGGIPIPPQPQGPISPGAMAAFQGVLGVFMAPFGAALGLVVSSGCAHLGLMATGGRTRDFSCTLAVYAYAMGAAGIFQVVPLCGGMAGGIWAMVCAVVGLIRVHRCPTWKALVSALWLTALCCCCVGAGIGFVVFAAGIASA